MVFINSYINNIKNTVMDKRPMGYVPGKGNVIFTSLLNI